MRFGLRQDHHHRQLAIGGKAVALVGPRVLFVEQDAGGGQHRAQRSNDFALAIDGESGCCWGVHKCFLGTDGGMQEV